MVNASAEKHDIHDPIINDYNQNITNITSYLTKNKFSSKNHYKGSDIFNYRYSSSGCNNINTYTCQYSPSAIDERKIFSYHYSPSKNNVIEEIVSTIEDSNIDEPVSSDDISIAHNETDILEEAITQKEVLDEKNSVEEEIVQEEVLDSNNDNENILNSQVKDDLEQKDLDENLTHQVEAPTTIETNTNNNMPQSRSIPILILLLIILLFCCKSAPG